MKYLKEFVIGSSCLVFLPFYYSVKNKQPKKTYNYYNYTLIAPIWFGIWNIISLIIAEYFGLSDRLRFLVISIISSLSIMCISYNLKSYTFTNTEWIQYFCYIFMKYLFTWNIVIFCLEKYS